MCATPGCTEPPPITTPPETSVDSGQTPVTELTIALSPTEIAIAQKASAEVTLSISRPDGMAEALALEVTGLPAGAVATTFNIPHDQSLATFRLSMGATTPQGSHVVDVTVRGATRSATAKLTVLVAGAPGTRDTSFGQDGVATVDANVTTMTLHRQVDGKLMLAGRVGEVGTRDFVVLRFTEDGALDSGFGSAGTATIDLGGDDILTGATLQPDGKLLMSGYRIDDPSRYPLAVVRLLTDGEPDPSFGTAGKMLREPSTYSVMYTLSLLGDGKILGAGYLYNGTKYNFTVFRITAGGELDDTFGPASAPVGYGVLNTGGVHDYAYDVTTDALGRLLLTGERVTGTGTGDLMIVRFTGSGELDSSFPSSSASPAGWMTGVSGGAARAFGWRIHVQPDGKILVGGVSPEQDFLLARFAEDGTPDPAFGTDGQVTVHHGPADRLWSMIVDPQGRILYAGPSASDATSKAVVGRLLSNGTPDPTFGSGGKVAISISGSGDYVRSIQLMPDGRILVGGQSLDGIPWITRLWP